MIPCALQVKLQHPHISPSCTQSNVSSRYRCNPASVSSPAPLLWKRKHRNHLSISSALVLCRGHSVPASALLLLNETSPVHRTNIRATAVLLTHCLPKLLSSFTNAVKIIGETTSNKAIETCKYPTTTPICCRLLKLLGGVICQVRPCIQASLSYRHGKLVGTCLKTEFEYGRNMHLMARPVLFLLDARLFSG